MAFRKKTSEPVIEFALPHDYQGVFPEPLPAVQALPEWWRGLPRERKGRPLQASSLKNHTVKACPPFFDGLTAGYVWRLPAALQVAFDSSGQMYMSWDLKVAPVSHPHGDDQLSDHSGHPKVNKFLNPWFIKTPPGYSCLFIPLANRITPFEILTGVVETDRYLDLIHFPWVWRGPTEGSHFFDAGAPIAQIIPFRREAWSHEHLVISNEEGNARRATGMAATARINGYKRLFHVKKVFR